MGLFEHLEIRYAYLIRYSDNELGVPGPFSVLVAMRAVPGKCPLLGMLRFLEDKVGSMMHRLLDLDGAEWEWQP